MALQDDTLETKILLGRINLQLTVGIVGIIFRLCAFALAASMPILYVMNDGSTSDFTNIILANHYCALVGVVFILVGFLGVLRKHNSQFTWLFAGWGIIDVIRYVYSFHIVNWFVTTFGDNTLHSILLSLFSGIGWIVLVFCLFTIRHEVRNQLLMWLTILAAALVNISRYAVDLIVYGLAGTELELWMQVLFYQLTSLGITIFIYFIVIWFFIDERKYGLYSSDESIAIDQGYDI